MRQSQKSKILSSTPRRQRGIVAVLFTIALVAMLGMVGLALDGAHGMLNKTRLQNTVDAAALSAAKTLDQTDDTVLAEAEALAMFLTNSLGAGNAEIAASYAGGQLAVSVQFSTTLHPFVPGSTPARYVNVTATNLRLPGWFIPVIGVNELVVGASAVAGPSPTLGTYCNIAPMMMCGEDGDDTYGYTLGVASILKASTNNAEIGPGNFQLIRLGDGQGGADVREAMAGSYDDCLSTGDTVPTEPGNTVGPVAQGLNTRFGIYSGPMNGTELVYPPDVVVAAVTPPLTYECEVDGEVMIDKICYEGAPLPANPNDYTFYDFDDYQYAIDNHYYDNDPIEDYGIGAFNRRVLAAPIGDCSTTTNGQGDVPILGFLCFYLLQPVEKPPDGGDVYGQFIENGCPITGQPSSVPGTGPGPYIIQLYKDESATAS